MHAYYGALRCYTFSMAVVSSTQLQVCGHADGGDQFLLLFKAGCIA